MSDNKTILIIEDDKFFRDMVSKKLESEGFRVLAVEDGNKAFEVLEKENPSLIVLDLILPGMSGYEVLSIIKKDEKTKDIPVIILSNLGQEEDVSKAKELGVDDFLIKVNYTPEEIVAKIREKISI